MTLNSRIAALALICASSSIHYDAHAAWETVPELSLFAETDDNILMDSTAEQSGSRTALDALVRLSNFNERGNIYIEPRVVTDAYTADDTKQFESDDVFFEAGGEHRSQTIDVGFRSSYSERNILNSEFEDLDPGDPDAEPGDDFTDPDTGRLLFFSETRELFDMRGNIDFRFSERNRFRLEAARQDVAYSGTQSGVRSDYDNNTVSLAMIRRIDERNTVSARVFTSEFYADDRDNTTDSVGVEGTFSRPLAPTWTLNLSAGVQRSEYDYLGSTLVRVENATTNSTFSMGFTKRAERTRWDLRFGQRVQPNGNGFLAVRDEVRGTLTYEFSPRLTGQFGALFSQTETLDDARAQDNRDYSRIGMGVEWAIKETLFFVVGYERINQDFTNDLTTQEATSNMLSLGVTYRGRSRQDQ